MLDAAIVGLGWWGKTLVEAISGASDVIRFTAAATRTDSDDARAFAQAHGLTLHANYEQLLSGAAYFLCRKQRL